jgi:hypothetical protein
MKPCNVCGVKPKAPGRGRRTCEDCQNLCKHCKGALDDKKRCNECTKKRNRERYQNDPEYAQYKKDMNKVSLYGMTWDEFHALSPVCETCGSTERLFIDHDHETGKVRGRLCHGCNSVLGFAKDNPSVMRNLIQYLEKS